MLGALLAPRRIKMLRTRFGSKYTEMDGEEYAACTEPIIGMFEVKARSYKVIQI